MEVLCPFYRGGNWSPQDCWTCSRSQRKKMVEHGFVPCRPAPGNWLVTTAWPNLPGAKVQCLRENCRNSGSGEPRSLGKGEFPIFEQGQSHRQFQLPLICPSGLVNLHTKNINRGIHAHAYQPDHLFPTRALVSALVKKEKKKKKLPKAPQNIQNALPLQQEDLRRPGPSSLSHLPLLPALEGI